MRNHRNIVTGIYAFSYCLVTLFSGGVLTLNETHRKGKLVYWQCERSQLPILSVNQHIHANLGIMGYIAFLDT